MVAWFLNFKATHPILFWITFPLTIALILAFVVIEYILGGQTEWVKDKVAEADKKDAALKEQEDKANAEANVHKAKADQIQQEINDTGVSEDWYKKQ
jgi:mannitol-specific phosphotransferase system IIBC component